MHDIILLMFLRPFVNDVIQSHVHPISTLLQVGGSGSPVMMIGNYYGCLTITLAFHLCNLMDT